MIDLPTQEHNMKTGVVAVVLWLELSYQVLARGKPRE